MKQFTIKHDNGQITFYEDFFPCSVTVMKRKIVPLLYRDPRWRQTVDEMSWYFQSELNRAQLEAKQIADETWTNKSAHERAVKSKLTLVKKYNDLLEVLRNA